MTEQLAKQLDDVSLDQALLDVDIATARVADLTSRLLTARHELLGAQDELTYLRTRVEALEAELDAVRRSRTYALASKLARLRQLAR